MLEAGCGTGVAAREIANRIGNGRVPGVDRSATAITQAIKNSSVEIRKGSLRFIQSKIEEFELSEEEGLFDFVFAVRVGALDGRHPETEAAALRQIRKSLKMNGKLFTDGDNPLAEIKVTKNQPLKLRDFKHPLFNLSFLVGWFWSRNLSLCFSG